MIKYTFRNSKNWNSLVHRDYVRSCFVLRQADRQTDKQAPLFIDIITIFPKRNEFSNNALLKSSVSKSVILGTPISMHHSKNLAIFERCLAIWDARFGSNRPVLVYSSGLSCTETCNCSSLRDLDSRNSNKSRTNWTYSRRQLETQVELRF